MQEPHGASCTGTAPVRLTTLDLSLDRSSLTRVIERSIRNGLGQARAQGLQYL